MVAARRLGLIDQQPPKHITGRVLRTMGTPVGGSQLDGTAVAAHEAFGALAGVGYAVLRQRIPKRVPDVALGVTYGIVIWLVSYRGLLPRLRLVTSGGPTGRTRDLVMLAAHVVYGWVLARLA